MYWVELYCKIQVYLNVIGFVLMVLALIGGAIAWWADR